MGNKIRVKHLTQYDSQHSMFACSKVRYLIGHSELCTGILHGCHRNTVSCVGALICYVCTHPACTWVHVVHMHVQGYTVTEALSHF